MYKIESMCIGLYVAGAEMGQSRIRGDGGVKNPPKKSDIIYVRSLTI